MLTYTPLSSHRLGWLVLSLLALMAMACQLGTVLEVTPTPIPVTKPPEVPTVTAVSPTQPPPIAEPTMEVAVEEALPDLPAAITIEDLQAATVQILAKQRINGRMQIVWTGSGTIISPDGYILTNAHVADPTAPGLAILYNDPDLLFSDEPDELVVAIVERADRPPVETYRAEALATDGVLDLSVIRITATIDGEPISGADLNLPYVELGDSDTINLGDEVQVLGFPDAGGTTLTFTRGDVSGFESQDRVGDRAWIKTDTTVSPGNSGGLGANIDGEIIGVPSFVIEATGGAINRLRSINLALPLIDAARAGELYESPYIVEGSGREEFTFITWAHDFDEADFCPISPVSSYAANSYAVVAVFSYEGMQDGEQVLIAWFLDDEILYTNIIGWRSGDSGDCFAVYTHNYGDFIDNGRYTVELYAGDSLDFVGSADVSVGGTAVSTTSNSSRDGVEVQGRIMDADTGKGITGATFVVLNPGTDLTYWLNAPSEADIYTLAEANSHGEYILPDLLERDVTYPAVAMATGYYPTDGPLTIASDSPRVIFLDLQLMK